MPTRLFRVLKYTYTGDDQVNRVRAQRVYGDSATRVILTPITPLFTDRQLPTGNVDAFTGDERYVTAFVENPNVADGYSRLKAFIPYAPNDNRLQQHIRQIIDVANVLCVQYHGEGVTNA